MKNIARTVLLWTGILLLAAGALYLACRKVDWQELLSILKQAHAGWLLAGCGTISVSYLIRGVRWRGLLCAERPVALHTVFWSSMVGYLGNCYLPARAGELMRSAMLGQRSGISTGYVLATALTERILDAIALVGIALVAVSTMHGLPSRFVVAAHTLGVIALTAVGILWLALHCRRVLAGLLRRLRLAEALQARIITVVEQFACGAQAIKHGARALQFTGLTAVIWLLDAVSSVIWAHALGLALTLPQALLLLAGLGISSTVPSAPGAVGIFQFVAVTILVPLGFTHSAAMAYILVVQACTYLVVTVWGGIGLGLWAAWKRQAQRPEVAGETPQPVGSEHG